MKPRQYQFLQARIGVNCFWISKWDPERGACFGTAGLTVCASGIGSSIGNETVDDASQAHKTESGPRSIMNGYGQGTSGFSFWS